MNGAVSGGLAGRWALVTYAAVAMVATCACRNVDVDTESYATLAEARDAGAIARGWMPALLPEGAIDIRLAHDRRSNRRWGLFTFSEADAAAFKAALHPAEVSLAGQKLDVPGRIEWWPVQLRGTLDESRIRDTGLRAFRTRQGDFVVAVNWNQRRAYYWPADA
jgi:hypothetical protein